MERCSGKPPVSHAQKKSPVGIKSANVPDFATVPAAEIKNIGVAATYVNGREVYRNNGVQFGSTPCKQRHERQAPAVTYRKVSQEDSHV